MKSIVKGIEVLLGIILIIMIILIVYIKLNNGKSTSNPNVERSEIVKITPFNLDNNNITYNKDNSNSSNQSQEISKNENINAKTNPKANSTLSAERKAVLDRAQAMVEVKWIPKYNLSNKYASYTFVKGKTYTGIPYSMDLYQVRAVGDFLSKISESRIIYGNDCSGFVSAVWGISRQTTLTFYEAVKKHKEIDGKAVTEISWEDLKPGDAILLDNGKGKGHIILFISRDEQDKDKMNVYEQNVPTIIPFEPMPVARKDIRSMTALKKEGYFPIRLKTLE